MDSAQGDDDPNFGECVNPQLFDRLVGAKVPPSRLTGETGAQKIDDPDVTSPVIGVELHAS